jgi:GT2 family glycosyltransferase
MDRGQYDNAWEMGAFCGCSVLLRRQALVETGIFDDDLFMYYEDTDLSWRLRKAGYRLRFQPLSVVRHVHAATSGEDSPLFRYFVTRNRLLLLLKHAPLGVALSAWAKELARTVTTVLRQRSTVAEPARTCLRVQASLLAKAPKALLKRTGLLDEPGLASTPSDSSARDAASSPKPPPLGRRTSGR